MAENHPYVSRGGIKLAAALDAFAIDPAGLTCADLGCNVGGFTDCLLQRNAARVFSVDTGYGTLAWKLRSDPRVTTLERTNAVHYAPTSEQAMCDLVVIDLGWTRQKLAIPAALRWLRKQTQTSGFQPAIISLIKPHYEAPGRHAAVLEETQARAELARVLDEMPSLGVSVAGCIDSPIRGGASKGHLGNHEFLALLRPVA